MCVSTIAILASFIILPQTALAQSQHADANEDVRDGFWFNGGLGYGTLGCENCSARS